MTDAPEIISRERASCALFRDAPSWGGRRTAAVGRFACGGAEAGMALLEEAAARLSGEGFAALVGPMDGDTWRPYRLVTESDGSMPSPDRVAESVRILTEAAAGVERV